MNNWRPDRNVGSNQTGFWGAVSFLSVLIKDRSLLVPFVMLNACLTFSWPNKVLFDHETSDMIRPGTYTGVHTGAKGSMTGTWRVSRRCVLVVGWSLGIAASVYPTMFTGIVSLVIYSSLDWWVWFVWGINHQLVRNRFESPSLLDSEHLTRATTS
jgi:hypothetical protein